MRSLASSTLLPFLLLACAGGSDGPTTAGPTPRTEIGPAASAPAPGGAASAAPSAAKPTGPVPCGALDCLAYDSVDAALAKVLESDPAVLGVGEAHAQKGTEGVASTTKRFTEQLLPVLAPKSGDLLLEVWFADPKCSAKRVAEVQKAQRPVTESQAATNPNEFFALGDKAKALGVQPHVLVPPCDEYEAIAKAGPDAVDKMLTMIGRLSAARLAGLLAFRADGGAPKLVIAYGGALHNDIEPAPGREAWSYGPDLAKKTGGRYVELDLIVPEFIKDTDTWKKLEWYPHYDKTKNPGKTTLFRPRPSSFVLIFASQT